MRPWQIAAIGRRIVLALAVACFPGLAPGRAEAQSATARETLEAGIRAYQADLPRRTEDLGRAIESMVRLDQPRAVELMREGLRIEARLKAKRADIGAYLVDTPFQALANADFDCAATLALEQPERLFPLLQSSFLSISHQQPDLALLWARRLREESPRSADRLIEDVLRTGYVSAPAGMLDLLPQGPRRSMVAADTFVYGLDPQRAPAPPSVLRMAGETLEGSAELDEKLYAYGSSQYPRVMGNQNQGRTVGDWLALAARLRSLPSEAVILGLTVAARRSGEPTGPALVIARSIRSPELRAVALAELYRRSVELGRSGEPFEGPRPIVLAREAEALLPQVRRPRLRAIVAEDVALAAAPGQAIRFLLTAIESTRNAAEVPFFMFGGGVLTGTRAEQLAGELGRLVPLDARLSRRKAHELRERLAGFYRTAVLNCAAHAPSRQQALDWLRTDLPSDPAARMDFAMLAAEVHPAYDLAILPDLPPGTKRDLVLIRLVPALALRSPQDAASPARYFASAAARSAAFEEAVRRAREAPVRARVLLAQAIPQPLIRADAIGPMISEAVTAHELPVPEAASILERLPPSGPKWQAMVRLIGFLPEDRALLYARRIGRYTERVEALRSVLARLAARDAERALREASGEADPEARSDLMTSLGAQLVESQPDLAARVARRLEHRPSREAIEMALIRQSMGKNLDQALAAAEGIVIRNNRIALYPELLGRALVTHAAPERVWPLAAWASREVWTTVDTWRWARDGRADWVPGTAATSGQAYSPYEGLAEALEDWARNFPAADWIAPLGAVADKDGKPFDPLFLGVFASRLAAAHTDAAVAVLERSRAGDTSWRMLLGSLAGSHPERVLPLADRIRDPAERLNVVVRFAERPPRESDRTAWRDLALRSAAEAIRAVPAHSDPVSRARTLLHITSWLRRVKLPVAEPLRLAREAARATPDLEVRAALLEEVERLESSGAK